MESISSFTTKQFELKKFNRKEDLSRRASLVKEFVEALNKEREGTKYKPLQPAYVATRLAFLDTWDLSMFLVQCRKAKSFGKTFFWAIKVKK